MRKEKFFFLSFFSLHKIYLHWIFFFAFTLCPPPLTAQNEQNETNGKVKKKQRRKEKGGIEFRERAKYFRLVKQNVLREREQRRQQQQRRKPGRFMENAIHFITSCEQLLSLILTHSRRAKICAEKYPRSVVHETAKRRCLSTALPPGLHQFSCYLVLFFFIFGWDLVSALLLTAKRHRRRSAISYGNWPRHIYGTIKFLLAPLKINSCVCVSDTAACFWCASAIEDGPSNST